MQRTPYLAQRREDTQVWRTAAPQPRPQRIEQLVPHAQAGHIDVGRVCEIRLQPGGVVGWGGVGLGLARHLPTRLRA